MFDSDGDKALEGAKKRSLKILGSRQMSSSRMEKRLIEKGETEENARAAVLWLEKIGAINDKLYAESICSYYSKKGYGLTRIKDELYKRGIDRDLWDEATCTIEKEDTNDAALKFLHKRLRGSSDRQELRRAAEALCRRGFGYDDAKKAINEYLENLEIYE